MNSDIERYVVADGCDTSEIDGVSTARFFMRSDPTGGKSFTNFPEVTPIATAERGDLITVP